MTLPKEVDIDKLISYLLDCEKKAIAGWLEGVPLDETAFLNRLTGQLRKLKRGCDVGVKVPVHAYPLVFELHRRAEDSSDAYGSDLGITLSVIPGNYVKTALFQLKTGEGFSAQLVRDQIATAHESDEVKQRSFVLYVDKARPSIRIASVTGMLDSWPSTQARMTFDASSWWSLTTWATEWLACKVGPISVNANSFASFENTLRRLRSTESSLFARTAPAGPTAWLVYALRAEGMDVAGEPTGHFFDRPLPPTTLN